MTQQGIRRWYLIHKWSSLIPTIFLLILCVTGLPLIFRQELAALLGDAASLPPLAAGAQAPRLDEIVSRALAARPGEVMQFLSFDADRPIAFVLTAPSVESPPDQTFNQVYDLRSGARLAAPPRETGFLHVMESLHEDLFLDLPGRLLLGVMALLLIVAIVSGVVVYAPFMRKLDFGTLRLQRSKRLRWLDVHNLLGIVTVVWLGVVGLTGVINALNPIVAGLWRMGQLAEMTAAYRDAPPIVARSSIDAAIATSLAAAPGMKVVTMAFPGTRFSSPHHYAVFMRGTTPVTSRLLKPALIDAQTGRLTDLRDMPLYVRALFISEPLHFGDYGGEWLKVVWALLDLLTVIVLGSGIYLWLGRRRASSDSPLAELSTGGEVNAP